MEKHVPYALVSILSLLVMTPSAGWSADSHEKGIGFYTAVSGMVNVTHTRDVKAVPVRLNDQVYFRDVIQTLEEARTRAFFDDDTILTVGANSRVEINEYVYQPEDNVRRAVVKLIQGQVRALVSKVFKANGSKFEVHTPTAVAAARGTYFTVWVDHRRSGIINIGETGRVDFTSGGVTVAVDPGYFSVAMDGEAPSQPARHHIGDREPPIPDSQTNDSELAQSQLRSGASLSEALAAVDLTMLPNGSLIDSPLNTLQGLGIDGQLLTSFVNMVLNTTEPITGAGAGSMQMSGQTGVNVASQANAASLSGGVTSTSLTASVGPISVAPTAPLVPATVLSGGVTSTSLTASVGPISVAPTAPLAPATVTPPAVINGALNLLK